MGYGYAFHAGLSAYRIATLAKDLAALLQREAEYEAARKGLIDLTSPPACDPTPASGSVAFAVGHAPVVIPVGPRVRFEAGRAAAINIPVVRLAVAMGVDMIAACATSSRHGILFGRPRGRTERGRAESSEHSY